MRRTLALLLVFVGVGCRSPTTSAKDPAQAIIPIDGPGVRQLAKSSRARGGVIINYWATWCAPCKEEFPMLVRVGQQYAARGFDLHFVSLDFPEAHQDMLAFLREQGAPVPSYVKSGKDQAFINAVHPRWSGALPMTQIYGPGRRVRYFWEGMVDEPTLTQALDTLAAEVESDL